MAKVHGTLVVAEDVVKSWTDVLGALKGKLLSIPTKAAPVVSVESEASICQDILEDLLNEALEELTTYEPSVNPSSTSRSVDSSENSDASAEATTKTKRKSVGRPKKTTRLTN